MKAERQKEKRGGRSALRLGMLGALLLAAAALKYGLSPSKNETPRPSPAPTAQSAPANVDRRESREAAYQKDAAALQAMTENEKLESAAREQAAEQLRRMVAGHQTELALEEALTQAGFSPVLVIFQNDALTVNVGAVALTAADSAAILSLCVAHSDVAAENVRIMTGGAS